MKLSKKNFYTILILIGLPAGIIIVFLVNTIFFTLMVDLAPAETPDKIILSNYSGIDAQYIEITNPNTINEIVEIFDELYICAVGGLQDYSKYNIFHRSPGLSIYRRITFEYEDGISFFYRFDFNRVERKGKTYWILGNKLSYLIQLLDNTEPLVVD